jgi:hypothetical protein
MWLIRMPFNKSLYFLRLSLKGVLILLLIPVVFFYLTCPIYDFPEPEPFSGPLIFNPYEGIDSLTPRKANFQVQSRAWSGVTDGHKNSGEMIYDRYRALQYEVITISDYMKINDFRKDEKDYVAVYEHGYGLRKNHQVVIGATKVTWRDYPLFQTIHHKQHIIDILARHNEMVFIAHPRLYNGYSPDDFQFLTGYDGVEVLNAMMTSSQHWDAALSSGRYVTIMGNDDAHDVSIPLEVGHRCTYLFTGHLTGEAIIHALRSGKTYAADIFRRPDETFEEKEMSARDIQKLTRVVVTGDTLRIEADRQATEFRFIGQWGKLLGRVNNTNIADFIISENDTYVRTEISFPDKNVLYLNPVVRYDGISVGIAEKADINMLKSWLFWGTSWSALALAIIFYLRRKLRQVTTGNQNEAATVNGNESMDTDPGIGAGAGGPGSTAGTRQR